MLNRLDRMIVLAGVAMLIGGVPALAHGGGSVGHSPHPHSDARVGASTKSIGPPPECHRVQDPSPALAARMLVTTALGARVMTTKASAVGDPPAADPPAPGAAAASTSGGAKGGSSTDLSQFNPGAQDLATPAVSPPTTTDITDLVAPSASGLLTTDITTTTLLTTGSQVTTGSFLSGSPEPADQEELLSLLTVRAPAMRPFGRPGFLLPRCAGILAGASGSERTR